MSYKDRIVKGIGWNFFLLVLSAPLGYLVRMIYANELPKLDVGLFYAIFDFCSIVAIFRNLGLNQTLIRFIPKYLAEKRLDLVKSVIVLVGILQTSLSLLATIIIIIFAPLIAKYYLNNQGQFTGHLNIVIYALIILSIGFWIQSISEVILNSIRGFQRQKYVGTIPFVRIFLILITSIVFIYILNIHNVFAPVYSYSLVPVLLITIYGYILIKKVFIEFSYEKVVFSKHLISKLFSYGFPIMLGSAGTFVLNYLDGICLTYFSGLNAVADYRNVAMPTMTMLSYLTISINTVLFPMASELWEKNRKDILQITFEKVYLYSLAIITPLVFLTFYFSDIIIILFFNPQYLSASAAIKILSLGAIFSTLNNIGFAILNGIGKPAISTKIIYIGAFFNLTSNILLIPKLGTVGASITTALSYLLMWVFQIKFISKKLQTKSMFKKSFVIFSIGLVGLAIPIVITRYINILFLKLIIGSLTYLIIYILLLYILKIVDIDEFKTLLKLKK